MKALITLTLAIAVSAIYNLDGLADNSEENQNG